MEDVTERLLHEEHKMRDRKNDGASTNQEALVSRHKKPRGPQCHFCRKFGHIKKNCREYEKTQAQSNQRKSDNRADRKSHKVNSIQTVEGSADDSSSDEVGLVVDHALAVKRSSGKSGSRWIIDSGATSHICNNRKRFTQLFPLRSPIQVRLGNGDSLTAVAQGVVKLRVIYGRHRSRKCSLTDVLYVPELSYNLLSVPKITEKGMKVNFIDSKCYVRDEKKRIIAVGEKHGGLYHVCTEDVEVNISETSLTVCRLPTKEDVWHYRFGHLSVKNLRKLSRDNLVDGFQFDPSQDIQFCDLCLEGKQHRKPFPNFTGTRAKEPLELVHTDVCGKLNVKSLSGSQYFVTFIDDYSRYVWIYVLKHKSDVFKQFVDWKTMVELSTGKKLKKLRSDNGGEYTSSEFEGYLREKGIEHQLTVPKCPQQNGIAERQNRTLMEMVRSMLASSKLPPRFWAEALSTAAYLRNRCPTRAVEGKTPFECLTGEKPDVEHLRIFGCAAHYHVPSDERHKLESKSRRGIFLGYSQNRKGYRLYDCRKQRVVHSRDVVFDETTRGVMPDSHEIDSNDQVNQQYVRVEEESESDSLRDSQTIESPTVPIQDDTPSQPEHSEDNPVPRRVMNRIRRRPDFYGDFVNVADQSTSEPLTIKEAITGKYKDKWKEAMESEMASLQANQVWTLVEPPSNAKVINSKWVFKHKIGENGLIERYKARLVAQGYSQRPGVDYEETFAPVVRFESLRVVLALAAQKNLKVHQLDVKTAFLNGELDELIYMKQPEGFIESNQENLVCRLNRSIYGLKQSPRCWNSALDERLKDIGFTQSKCDPCIYVAETGEPFFIAIYVDDILLAGATDRRIAEVKEALTNRFDIKDMGKVNCFLGVKIVQDVDKGTIWAGQTSYTESILKQFNMSQAKSCKTPVNSSVKLVRSPEDSEGVDQVLYQSAVGKLLYLSTRTRPDIAFAVSRAARYVSNPSTEHWKVVKHILRYLVGTINHGILFNRSCNDDCTGYSDSDWGGDLDDRKSTSGYVYMMAGGPVSWCSRKQSTVALSTSEAEYVALASAAQEAIWLRQLISDLTGTTKMVTINEDNQSAICLSKNPQYHGRSKHISIKHHFIRDKVKDGSIGIQYCCTSEMIADTLTKGLSGERFMKLKRMMNIQTVPVSISTK